MQLGAAAVEEQSEVGHHQVHRGAGAAAGMQHYNGSVTDSGSTHTDTSRDHTLAKSDVDHASFDAPDPYATAIRISGSNNGVLILIVESDAELGRATGERHESRSAYLTLTNNGSRSEPNCEKIRGTLVSMSFS